MHQNQSNNTNNNRKIKSLRFEGCFMILNQILNILLILLNISFGNIYLLIFAIINSISGLIFYFKYEIETTILISNIVYIILTLLIFICYYYDKII